ncbi:class I SAM-dependent methyltransferase [Methylomonas koyamae]|uniref:class I SAM-dependent methyltransferase n=1 Tax=Methylomonas koyamae TaxID=702114 RepID=UPI000B2373FE|nr:class I SAM-dependent methyltransferase [Methylomonas koyamae]
MHIYNDRFYDNQSTGSLKSAKAIVPIINEILSPQSVVDLGCGIGTWLSAFIEMGIDDILGIDGPYVEKNKLLINEANFLAADLEKPILLDRKFDLAISLEVAEHIPDIAANTFVSSLTSLSDVIIFSAALPYQGGENHINEQWPEYWSDKFVAAGYTPIDYLRLKLWNDSDIEFWYRQNILYI